MARVNKHDGKLNNPENHEPEKITGSDSSTDWEMIRNIVIAMPKNGKQHHAHDSPCRELAFCLVQIKGALTSIKGLDTKIYDGNNRTDTDEELRSAHSCRSSNDCWISEVIFRRAS